VNGCLKTGRFSVLCCLSILHEDYYLENMPLMKLVSNFMSMGFSLVSVFFVVAFRERASFTNLGDVRSFGKLFTEMWMALSFRCALQMCLSSSLIFAFTILYHLY